MDRPIVLEWNPGLFILVYLLITCNQPTKYCVYLVALNQNVVSVSTGIVWDTKKQHKNL
jgi:hypothetical protein